MAVLMQLPLHQDPPSFCAYAAGPCDQDFTTLDQTRGLFLYASRPTTIANAIEHAVDGLRKETGDEWRTWSDLDVPGRIVFCEICQAMRGATTIYADVTTLNFNLLFEIGFALGLGLPVRPIRDTSYSVDKKAFDALGVLDTLGYADFTNADNLAEAVLATDATAPLDKIPKRSYLESPLYVLKGPIDTDGAVRLQSLLKKSHLGFRTHDPVETPRLSLHAARKQVTGAYGLVAHLLSPNRDAARVHNALCALLCGMAVAQQKPVLMLQEEAVDQPIDYRDLVQPYESADQIPALLEEFLPNVVTALQRRQDVRAPQAPGLLDELDLGDTAAENEIQGLRNYFVRTGVFKSVVQGHARLVVGRKGSGKTAMFYGVRTAVKRGHDVLVLDMKPEGHQFTRLREAVLEALTEGQKEYTLAAFWTYLLSAEVAHKILSAPSELRAAERDPGRFERYTALQEAYLSHGLASGDDLSQRLLRQIDRIAERFKSEDDITARTDLRELVYGGDIRTLNDAVAEYLVSEKDSVWLLIDNLDKSWATRGSTREDMLIMRGLLDASEQLQRQLEKRDVVFRSVVFVRTDVYEHLVERTPDRGKEGAVTLDWDDRELFREIVRKRVVASTDLEGTFEEVWSDFAPSLVGIEDAFRYMLDRTLMRPRDFLMFLGDAVQVAISRGHDTVTVDDIKQAETSYSEDMLLGLVFEIEDTRSGIADAVYDFHGAPAVMARREVEERVHRSGLRGEEVGPAIELLLWYGFLGIKMNTTHEEQYSFGVRYNLRRLTHVISNGQAKFVVHPAFRVALSVGTDA